MHFACLVKQACVDLVSDLFVYYRLGCELFVCSWGLHLNPTNYGIFTGKVWNAFSYEVRGLMSGRGVSTWYTGKKIDWKVLIANG